MVYLAMLYSMSVVILRSCKPADVMPEDSIGQVRLIFARFGTHTLLRSHLECLPSAKSCFVAATGFVAERGCNESGKIDIMHIS
jgi:hypothetical protein